MCCHQKWPSRASVFALPQAGLHLAFVCKCVASLTESSMRGDKPRDEATARARRARACTRSLARDLCRRTDRRNESSRADPPTRRDARRSRETGARVRAWRRDGRARARNKKHNISSLPPSPPPTATVAARCSRPNVRGGVQTVCGDGSLRIGSPIARCRRVLRRVALRRVASRHVDCDASPCRLRLRSGGIADAARRRAPTTMRVLGRVVADDACGVREGDVGAHAST